MKYDLKLPGEDQPITRDTLGEAIDSFLHAMPARLFADRSGSKRVTLIWRQDAPSVDITCTVDGTVIYDALVSERDASTFYLNLDEEAIVGAVRGGARRLSTISLVAKMEPRKVDGILQRLRKNGVLTWMSKPGWTLVDKKPAATVQIATVEAFDGSVAAPEPPSGESAPESILAPKEYPHGWGNPPHANVPK